MSLEWVILAGVFKSLMDRASWGSDPNDNVELFYERWRWYQLWLSAEPILWVEIDAWHTFCAALIFCCFRAFGGWLDSAFATLIVLTVFTLFYHGLLLCSPVAGLRDWLKRYFKRDTNGRQG